MHSKIDYPENNTNAQYALSESVTCANLHYGHIVERVVRRDCMGISEIARKLHVSRRTLYNWFEMNKLGMDVICKIGNVTGHDFSNEFPDDFANHKDVVDGELYRDSNNLASQPHDAVYYWMDRYIKLLEKFNETLSNKKLKNEIMTIAIVSSVISEMIIYS
jgi:transcriptional regulator with XRE-family HTH domain